MSCFVNQLTHSCSTMVAVLHSGASFMVILPTLKSSCMTSRNRYSSRLAHTATSSMACVVVLTCNPICCLLSLYMLTLLTRVLNFMVPGLQICRLNGPQNKKQNRLAKAFNCLFSIQVYFSLCCCSLPIIEAFGTV